mgnify:CR=1 FL=1
MTTRFFLVIVMLVALFGAWQYLGYEHALSTQSKLDAISKLSVYAYIADSTKVQSILTEIKPIPAVRSVIYETASEAANELVTAYDLPLSEEMIADYKLPAVITISFEPNIQALKSKPLVLDILRSHISEADIDSQATAYNSLLDELKVLNRRSIVFHIFTSIVLLLIFVFSRLSYELHTLLLSKGKHHTVVDIIRHHKQGVEHTWSMLLIPLPISIAGYFGFIYLQHLPMLVPYWVFLAQLAAAFIGTLITHFTLHTFEHEVALAERPVQIINPNAAPTLVESEDETQPS